MIGLGASVVVGSEVLSGTGEESLIIVGIVWLLDRLWLLGGEWRIEAWVVLIVVKLGVGVGVLIVGVLIVRIVHV